MLIKVQIMKMQIIEMLLLVVAIKINMKIIKQGNQKYMDLICL